jgi:putative heme transporter
MVVATPLSRLAKGALSLGLAAAIVVWAVPRAGGVGWAEIGQAVTALSVAEVGLLSAVWLAGLWVHTMALTAAMPGLSGRRALFLNLTGSAVSNVLPLGGAAGTLANYTMSRAWGFSPSTFARWALVTNIWDTLAKLVLPGVALCWLAVAGVDAGGALGQAAAVGAALLVLALAAVRGLIAGDRGARTLGVLADRVASALRRPHPMPGGYAAWAVHLRRDSADLIATAWARLTVGKASYALLQAALLWLCLASLGTAPGLAVVFAAFALERILSIVVITPAATGIVEVGMTGLLVGLGAEPVTAAAGVVVYRAITVGLEIPVGGLGLVWWWAARRRTRPPAPVPAVGAPVGALSP